MNVGELKQLLKTIPDDYFILLKNYFDDNKKSDTGEIEFLESIEKECKMVVFRIKPEDRYV